MSNPEINDLLSILTKDLNNVEVNKENESIVSFAGQMIKLNTEEDAKPITDAIDVCSKLVTLNLEGNTLGINAGKGLGKSLECKSSLENVLFNNLFTGRLKTEIPEVLMFVTSGIMLSNAKLKILDLSDNAIGPVGMPSLLPFLQSEACQSLQVLRLNNCGLGIGGGQILAKGLVNLKQLKTLICGRNRLEILGATAIGNALAELTTLETLEMPQNGIHTKGIEAICKAVEANKGLKNLNLNDNNLKVSAKSVANAIKTLKSIETINFGDCLLRRAGCISICNAIIESDLLGIREMNLSGNEIGGEEAIDAIIRCSLKISESSERTEKLKLDLSNNNFGESGVKRLSDASNEKTDLILNDDEGSEDEAAEEEEGPEEEEVEEDEGEANNRAELEAAQNESVNVHKTESLIEELAKKIENESSDINDLCSQFVNISINGFDSQTAQLKDEALIESELYLKYAIEGQTNEFLSINTLLVNLGLLKDESGHYKKVDDLRGPLLSLTHSIKLLSPQQKQVLRAFMNRPNRSVEQCGKIKHSLMQKLFI